MSPRSALADRLAERVRRFGSLPFSQFVDAALYDAGGGFYAMGGGAGRAGRDFVTSPEVGSLFGTLVADAVDRWWLQLGAPDPFVVIEAGAGRGRLAHDILTATPQCSPALRYVLVERSLALRESQVDLLALEPSREALGPILAGADPDEPPSTLAGIGPIATSLEEVPAGPVTGVVLANELLDNLAFDIGVRTADGWSEVRVGLEGDRFVEVLVPAQPDFVDELPSDLPVGARVPVPSAVEQWLRGAAGALQRGWVVIIDYGADRMELASRGGWLRTYAGHGRGSDPLVDPGGCDITTDVAFDVVRRAATRVGLVVERELTQADWLRELGIDDRVAEARRVWKERAALGDLPALAARSRVSEAEALLDPTGLGAHRVLVLRR